MKLWKKNLILGITTVAIAAAPLAIWGGHEFGGADGEASDVVAEIDSSYEPWAESLWEPPSGEIESLLFCVQAAIGAGVVGFAIGRLTSKKNGNR